MIATDCSTCVDYRMCCVALLDNLHLVKVHLVSTPDCLESDWNQ